ncbi:BrnT family toxin [Bdellovibrio bacteriovorus]|uniref:BrnT family toxin n=1 Tax=Bdellovibrio bacteriovorus TaxID=959 RepID=UPI0005A17919
MEFEWDDEKAQGNYKKHGIRFSEAVTTFRDSYALEMLDQESSASEDRWLRLGRSSHLKVLVVVYCERLSPERVRIISARRATSREIEYYLRGLHEE